MRREESQYLGYSFEFNGGIKNVYSFQTVLGCDYNITFKPTPYLFGENAVFSYFTYEFSIVLAKNPMDKEPPVDLKIPPTIAAIFSDFFNKTFYTVVVYICDSSDGRQIFRKRKFDRWFEYYKGDSFIKIDASFDETDGNNYPVSLILKERNPFRNEICTQFMNIVGGFNEAK